MLSPWKFDHQGVERHANTVLLGVRRVLAFHVQSVCALFSGCGQQKKARTGLSEHAA